MQWIDLKDVAPREVFPGHRAQFVHGERMTVAHWHIDAGSTVPEHQHPHEQIVNVLSGRYELTVDGKPLQLEAADASVWIKRDGHWRCAVHTESVKGDPFGRDRK